MNTPHSARPPRKLLLRDAAAAGIAAAIATTATAAAARGLDVNLRVDGKAIPLSAFAFWTVVATALGTILALALRNRNRFLKATVPLTAISLVPAAIARTGCRRNSSSSPRTSSPRALSSRPLCAERSEGLGNDHRTKPLQRNPRDDCCSVRPVTAPSGPCDPTRLVLY